MELPFKDIDKLSFTKQRQEITIGKGISYDWRKLSETTCILEISFEKIKQCEESMKKIGGDIKKTTQWIEKNFLGKVFLLLFWYWRYILNY